MGDDPDLSTPRARREALRRVDPDDPRPHHAVLQRVLDLERAWRESPTAVHTGDAFENVHLAALLLFLVGDPADAPRLHGVKFATSSFDLATGSDAQSIFGAGRAETLDWLLRHGYAAEHAELTRWLAHDEDPTIEEWASWRRHYFYAPDGSLRLDPLPG